MKKSTVVEFKEFLISKGFGQPNKWEHKRGWRWRTMLTGKRATHTNWRNCRCPVCRRFLAIVEETAASAVNNECATKGLDASFQGAFDNAACYADQAGIPVNTLRDYLVREYRAHLEPSALAWHINYLTQHYRPEARFQ